MASAKAFAKTEHKIITLTIDEQGDAIFLASPENDVFLELGNVVTKRASHVEPGDFWTRLAFRAIRLFGDHTRLAKWTRRWECGWRVDTRPVGGPILHYWNIPMSDWSRGVHQIDDKGVMLWFNRQDAIDAEIKFLNEWFLERGIQ